MVKYSRKTRKELLETGFNIWSEDKDISVLFQEDIFYVRVSPEEYYEKRSFPEREYKPFDDAMEF